MARRGITSYSLKLDLPPIAGLPIDPATLFKPVFGFRNGYLVAANSSSDLRRAIKRLDREDDPQGDIRGNPEFAAVAARIPAKVSSISFTDSKASFEGFYQLAAGLLAMLPLGEDVPLDLALLPDPSTLTQHLSPSLSYSTVGESSAETVSVSPWGPEVMPVFAAIFGTVGWFAAQMRGF